MDTEPTLDQESQQQLTEAQEVALMLKGTAWSVVEQKLRDKILDVQNINNIDPSNLEIDLKARVMCAKILYDWLKDDIYGFVEQVKANIPIQEGTQSSYLSTR
jgi:hypothetical protein